MLGKNCVCVEDINKIPEVIVSILELHAGKSVDEVVNSWDGSTAVVVKDAITGLYVVEHGNELVEF